jgi:hypothetical protein
MQFNIPQIDSVWPDFRRMKEQSVTAWRRYVSACQDYSDYRIGRYQTGEV